MQRHVLNKEFQWQDAHGPFRLITEKQATDWNESGYFLLEDAFDSACLNDLLAAIDPIERLTEEYLQNKLGGKAFIARAGEITFTTNVSAQSRTVRNWIKGSVFQDLCYDLVGPTARLYWDMAVYKKPGTEKPFPWHQDNGYTFVEPQQYLTCWIALNDATESNGCPWVVPGCHREGTLHHRRTEIGFQCIDGAPESAKPMHVPAGSIAVMSSLSPHATAHNRTNEVRKAYIAQFGPDGAVSISLDKSGNIRRNPSNLTRQIPILIDGHPP